MTETIMDQPEKHFPEWMQLKEKIHKIGRIRTFNEGEVWWAAVGENIGVEINGKHRQFSRPVVIVKKFSRYSFLAIPFTSKYHEGTWWCPVEFLGNKEYACLTQSRAMSVSRLLTRMGTLPETDTAAIKQSLKALLFE